jgi:organic radical activating enzyme
VVFVQECNLHCENCFNPRTHPFVGNEKPVANVLSRVLSHLSDRRLNGATFSGGEPLQQAEDLSMLLKALRSTRPDISIGLFTGYSLGELATGAFWTRGGSDPGERMNLWRSIRNCLDFAVMGRYNRLQPSRAPLRSSRNQELHIFTSRHKESDFKEQAVESRSAPMV